MANFRTNGSGPFDVSILSHEIAEWLDDPGGFNTVPPWGNIGDVTGCRRYLEVGDPLTRTDLPAITSPNGFAYHLHELAYFSWFFRTASIGAGAQFSDNGTLVTSAGQFVNNGGVCCAPSASSPAVNRDPVRDRARSGSAACTSRGSGPNAADFEFHPI